MEDENKTKKKEITRKEIAKQLLVRELESPEQLDKLEPDRKIELDTCINDDEKIEVLRSIIEARGPNGGRRALTHRVWMLWIASRSDLDGLEYHIQSCREQAERGVMLAHKEAAKYLPAIEFAEHLEQEEKDIMMNAFKAATYYARLARAGTEVRKKIISEYAAANESAHDSN